MLAIFYIANCTYCLGMNDNSNNFHVSYDFLMFSSKLFKKTKKLN